MTVPRRQATDCEKVHLPSRLLVLVSLLLSLTVAAASLAAPERKEDRRRAPEPTRIDLPDGWQPEGIDALGSRLFVGSIPTGSIWLASARTGKGEPLVEKTDRAAIGLEVRHGNLYVAGGPKGRAYLYDARTGKDIAELQLAPAGVPTFVNDVVVSGGHAYFTDSRRPVLYVVDKDGSGFRELALTGFPMADGNNLNGIVAAGGDRLLAVQGNVGKLWLVDADTGVFEQVDLGAFSPVNGDGMLRLGRTLLIVQNRLNRIAVVKLASDLRSGRLVKTVEKAPGVFDVPTTIAHGRKGIYVVNARFGTTDPQPARYDIVKVG